VQTLSPTLIPCHAAGDRETAARIAAFLEECGDVRVLLDEGAMQPGDDLAEKAREARTADVVLVLFSHQSLPRPWLRRQWEDALVREPAEEGTRIAFGRIDDCVPPKVLVPQFELPRELRQFKRWIRRQPLTFDPPELGQLAAALADRPACETAASRALAHEFVDAYREDFDGVFRLECGDRSLAALVGDWAAQLGLRLEGQLEENLERLREFCSARRFLLLLEGAVTPAGRQLIFGGRCSTLIVEDHAAAPVTDPLHLAQRAFRDPAPDADWTELCALARQGRRLSSEQGRIAECYELMEQWHAAAEARADRVVLEESAREMVWILEQWGRTEEAARLEYRRATEYADQMLLPL